MLTATLTGAAILATTPTVRAPDFGQQLDTAEIISHGDDLEIRAYGEDGNIVGTIAAWADPEGAVHVASDYDDGWAETVIYDGEVVSTDGTLPGEVLAVRAESIAAELALTYGNDSQAKTSWIKCGAYLAGTAIGCGMAQPGPCVVGSILMACECLPLVVEEWEDMECG